MAWQTCIRSAQLTGVKASLASSPSTRITSPGPVASPRSWRLLRTDAAASATSFSATTPFPTSVSIKPMTIASVSYTRAAFELKAVCVNRLPRSTWRSTSVRRDSLAALSSSVLSILTYPLAERRDRLVALAGIRIRGESLASQCRQQARRLVFHAPLIRITDARLAAAAVHHRLSVVEGLEEGSCRDFAPGEHPLAQWSGAAG